MKSLAKHARRPLEGPGYRTPHPDRWLQSFTDWYDVGSLRQLGVQTVPDGTYWRWYVSTPAGTGIDADGTLG